MNHTDHPQPEKGLQLIIGFFLLFFLLILLSSLIWDFVPGQQYLLSAVLLFFILVLLYGLWMVSTTFYAIDKAGIRIRFGFAAEYHDWHEFSQISHRKGLFTLKIGWIGLTPCVRLKNALVLRRKNSRFPLYLTPSDPEDFLERILEMQARQS